jgi:NAD+ diphosphatase
MPMHDRQKNAGSGEHRARLLNREVEPAEISSGLLVPEIRSVILQGDEYLFATRLYRTMDRRGEVVMAVEHPAGSVLLHTKGWYEFDVYRLPTGGIQWDESVKEALHRELEEETGLMALEVHMLGVLDCTIRYKSEAVDFSSYVFHIPESAGELRLSQHEDITALRSVPIGELPAIADELRRMPAPRNGWGRWRALAHDLVHEMLIQVEEPKRQSVADAPGSED